MRKRRGNRCAKICAWVEGRGPKAGIRIFVPWKFGGLGDEKKPRPNEKKRSREKLANFANPPHWPRDSLDDKESINPHRPARRKARRPSSWKNMIKKKNRQKAPDLLSSHCRSTGTQRGSLFSPARGKKEHPGGNENFADSRKKLSIETAAPLSEGTSSVSFSEGKRKNACHKKICIKLDCAPPSPAF